MSSTESRKNALRVKEAKKRSHLTYEELAELTGMKVNSLVCWCTLRREPSDLCTSAIEDKVNVYLGKACEYINRTSYRSQFAEAVENILASDSLNKYDEILQAFDRLPAITLDRK